MSAGRRTTTPAAGAFPIPMRGNEERDWSASLRVGARFPIPMRGNERAETDRLTAEYGEFPIPMRGNEDVGSAHEAPVFNVSNPHEG